MGLYATKVAIPVGTLGHNNNHRCALLPLNFHCRVLYRAISGSDISSLQLSLLFCEK